MSWIEDKNYMNFYSIKSKADGMNDDGFHKLRAYLNQHHVYRKWGNMDYLRLWNIIGMIIHKTLNVLYFIF